MSNIFALFLLLIPLVVFHELGHFLAAKAFGIRVHQFAFGFGKKLMAFTYGETEYRFNLLPFGGYVDFMGESLYTYETPDDPRHFLNKSKSARFIVLFMGPMFNFIMAFGLFVFLQHQPERQVKSYGDHFTVGYVIPDSPESVAGLQVGDSILALNGEDVTDAESFYHNLAILPGKEINLKVQRQSQILMIDYTNDVNKIEGIGEIHFNRAVRSIVFRVEPGYPAEAAGLLDGDIINAINGETVFYGGDGTQSHVTRLINQSPDGPILFGIEREGQALQIPVETQLNEEGKRIVGVSLSFEGELVRRNWLESMVSARERCTFYSTFIFRTIHKLVKGDLSIKTMSGPVGVARIAKEELARGWFYFLTLMAILSLNLGIANLLPIPVLDGGEMLVIMVEWVARRNFSFDTKMMIKKVGFVFLIGLMGTVLVSDTIKEFMLR